MKCVGLVPLVLFATLSWMVAAAATCEGPAEDTGSAERFEFKGVSFAPDSSVVEESAGEVVAAAPTQGPLYGNPQFIRLSLNHSEPIGTGLAEGRRGASHRVASAVHVYPVAEYVEVIPQVEAVAQALRSILDDPARLEAAGALPLLPVGDARQAITVQRSVLRIENGHALRFLTQLDQGPNPITNDTIFYTVQGLSDDGQWYVAAFFPVTTTALDGAAQSFSADVEAAGGISGYLAEIARRLEALRADDFEPDLDALDRMFETLRVEPVLGG